MAPHFTRKLIKTVNNWQAGSVGKKSKAEAIRKALAEQPIDSYLTSCDVTLYRRSVLAASAVTHLFFKFCVPEETSSWTTSFGVASRFKGGPPDPPDPGVIFAVMPKANEVVLNLDRLYQHPEFKKSVAHWKSEGLDLSKGIERYGNSQLEVVLTLEKVPHDDIYAFGSNSATSALQNALGLTVVGKSDLDVAGTQQAFDEAGLTLNKWITGDGTQRIYDAWVDKVTNRLNSLPPPPARPSSAPPISAGQGASPPSIDEEGP